MATRQGPHLDAGDQNLLRRALLNELGSITVDGPVVAALCGQIGTVQERSTLGFASRGLSILPMGPSSSTGSPITFMILPRVPRPTGICTVPGVEYLCPGNLEVHGTDCLP